ncbi:DUF3088 family protein [Leisingera sp. F5]|uniref:DUF3088 family protein n=1 Tax=Leisingera sp. F5 TaxID=1813816 RepID=UPI000B1DAF00|nr:DUF3088 family protein [Leisingera sp. F5]
MAETILYLLKSDFIDAQHGDRLFYCPSCLKVEGLLSMFPKIRQELDVRYVDFARPRGDMSGFVGESQGCPHIVLPGGDDDHSAELSVAGAGIVRRIEKDEDIFAYLINRFGVSHPHP